MGTVPLTLTAIHRYPVKSCRGEAVQTAVVEPWGLAGDRRWMVVVDDGRALTAREHPRLLLSTPQLTESGLRISHPDVGSIEISTPDGHGAVAVGIWNSTVTATPAGDDARAWFTKVLGLPAQLVYLHDPTQRPTNPLYSKQSDRVSFADGYPLLLASEDSLAALNDYIAEGPRADEGPVPMSRFRPSVVVQGAAAWAEDGWRRLRIGSAHFRAVKGCDRCVLTTIDPQTARRGKEPIATLARHRTWDGKTWFAMNLIPDDPGATISVGDEVEIIDVVESDGPPR